MTLCAPLASISSYGIAFHGKRSVEVQGIQPEHTAGGGTHVFHAEFLLGFFRLESGGEKAVSVPFRLCSVTEILETDFMPLAAGKNLLLNVLSAGDAVVIGDRDRIIQIGSNLLSNAIKFTEREVCNGSHTI